MGANQTGYGQTSTNRELIHDNSRRIYRLELKVNEVIKENDNLKKSIKEIMTYLRDSLTE